MRTSVSRFTRFDFKDACLLNTFIDLVLQVSKFVSVSVFDMLNESKV